MVGLLAEDEEGYSVVGLYVEQVVDVRRHELEYEHYVVSLVQVQLLVLLDAKRNLFLLLGLFHDLLHVYLVGGHHLIHIRFLIVASFVREGIVDPDVLAVKHLVLLQIYLRCQTIFHLLFLLDQRQVVDLSPSDSLHGVVSQAAVDEVSCLRRDVDARKVRTGLLDFFEDLEVTYASERVLSVE